MLDLLESPIVALVVTIGLAALPWTINRVRLSVAKNFRRLDSPASAWARVERFSKISGSSPDIHIREAIHGALFDALRTTTFRQVRRPWRRHLVIAGIYILLGGLLFAMNLIAILTNQGGIGTVLSIVLGLAVAGMSTVWIQSALQAFRRNVVFRSRIELLIERKDLRFVRDPVRTVWLHGADSLTDQAFDSSWVRLWHALDEAQVRKAKKLALIIQESFDDMRRELSSGDRPADDVATERIDELEERINSWFRRQTAYRRPIGPRRSALQIVKSLGTKRSIVSLRSVRGSF